MLLNNKSFGGLHFLALDFLPARLSASPASSSVRPGAKVCHEMIRIQPTLYLSQAARKAPIGFILFM